MKEEVKELVEESEQDKKTEHDIIMSVSKQIEEDQKKEGFVINDIPQKFGEGMLESTTKRSDEILNKFKVIFEECRLEPSILRALSTQTKANELDKFHPVMFFGGEHITVSFLVPATDRYGNDGKKWLKQEEYEKIKQRGKNNGNVD